MPVKKEEKPEKKAPGTPVRTRSLRSTAEKKLAHASPSVHADTKGQSQEKLIHELQVHQIELEMQAEELKRTQLALEESRDQYLDLYEFAPLGYITLTEKALISRANLTASVLLGIDRTKLVTARFRKWVAPDDHETWDRYFRDLQMSDEKRTVTLLLVRSDGTTFPARLESIRLPGSGEGHSIRVAVSDISDIRKAERELHSSGDRIRFQARMLDAVGDAVIAVDTGHRIIFWNEAATRTYGWEPEEVLGRTTLDVTIPEISKNEAQKIHSLLNKGEVWSGEFRVRHRNGREFPVHMTDSPVYDDSGNLIAIIGVSHDISEQKRADDVLRNSEDDLLRAHELLEAVTKGTDVIIAVQDTDFRYIFFNQTYKEEIKRLTGKDLTLGTSMVEVYAGLPAEQERTIKAWSKVIHGENVNQMVEFSDPDGNRRIYHVLHTAIRDTSGMIIGAGEVAFNITKQSLVEDALRETKEYLDNLITYANAPIIVWDPRFRITRFNRAFEHLTGRSAEDVIGKPLDILIPPKCADEVMDLIRNTMQGTQWESVEMPILTRKGGIRTILWNSAAIFKRDGRTIISVIAQGQDITDRKKREAEHKLRASEYAKLNIALAKEIRQREEADATLKNTLSLLNASLESTADGIFVVDQENRIRNYNKNFVNMWNIPPALMEAGNHEDVMNYVLPQLKNPGEFSASIRDLDSHPGRESFDMIEFADGKIFERYSKPQMIGDCVVGRVWSFRDITDRKHAEEKLVASVQEKEVLLREIHHRVKNNLQLISGLLDLTRMNSSDDTTNGILTDMMFKIQTMAQIHTRLYESKQFGKINLSSQIRDQIGGLSSMYSHAGHEIICEVADSPEAFLPVDKAIPCALVINEILSNAYKHAFKGRKKGMIEVLAVQEDGRIKISIRDNGIGFPDNFDVRRTNSLGLQLTRTLMQQLKGSITFNSRNGAEVSIDFPAQTPGVV